MTKSEFEKIYLEHFDAVHKFLLKLCRDARTADEIASDTFFKAMSAIDRFDARSDIRSWLCQIAKNSYFSYLRECGRSVPLDSVSEMGNTGFGFEQQLDDAEASITIIKALHSMQEPYKEVFTLRVFGELSFKQIAEIFGKTDNWACVTFHRAKSKLQTILEESE